GSSVSSADVISHCRAQKLSKVAAHLLNLPPVRDLSLSRTKAGGYREIVWSQTGNVEAAPMFITGEEPDEPCHHCSRGNGPFSIIPCIQPLPRCGLSYVAGGLVAAVPQPPADRAPLLQLSLLPEREDSPKKSRQHGETQPAAHRQSVLCPHTPNPQTGRTHRHPYRHWCIPVC
ncbi:hypothetical protein C8A05DRAFT_20352, partial [Staphylotrichum tortipilum]